MNRIITFYSYKGGVGRSFALANIAVLLSQAGERVAVMDWDLEAPGLQRYFRPHLGKRLLPRRGGLIHLLHEATRNAAVDWQPYVVDVRIEGAGLISLLASGDHHTDYAQRLQEFSWERFFSEQQGGAILERWREEWSRQYDYVLIDSRTGVTDIGGVCTILLPDIVVLVFMANSQSFERGMEVVAAVQEARRELAVLRFPAAVLPLLGRFDGREERDEARRWLDRFSKELAALYEDWLPARFEPRQILELTKIPYVAKFSFGEPLPVLTDGVRDPDGPGFYLANVTRLLASDFADAEGILSGETAPASDRAAVADVRVSLGTLGVRAPEILVGRDRELAALDAAWEATDGRRPHVVTWVAPAGQGKTALVAHWMDRLGRDRWRGAERVFEWSFAIRDTASTSASLLDGFFSAALKFFADERDKRPVPNEPKEKGARLAEWIGQRRSLVVLDGLEVLQKASDGLLIDDGVQALLQGLARQNKGLCVITTRRRVMELSPSAGGAAFAQELGALSTDHGVELLKLLGMPGDDGVLRQLVDRLEGNANSLTLTVLELAKGADIPEALGNSARGAALPVDNRNMFDRAVLLSDSPDEV